MDFTLSKEHEMARQLFKDFAENEVKPLAQEGGATYFCFCSSVPYVIIGSIQRDV